MHTANRLSIIATAGALLVAVAACQTLQQPEWPLPPGVKTLPVNGYPMAYVERGSGPTLVLVPGSLNDYRYWTPQFETLSSRFRIVAVSPRHYYPERWNGKGTFGLEQHAQDLATFIEELDAGPVHLVGWSRGGQIAVRTALARPELVRKLVLMDPGFAELVPATGSGKPPPGAGRLATGAEEFFKKGDLDGGLQYFFDGVNGAGAWQKLPEEQRRFRIDNAWTLVGQAADANAKPVTCADLGGLKAPVIFMTGDKSPPQYKPYFDAFQRCQPAATRVVIPNAMHQMSQNNPPAVDAALTKFLLE
ncbi:MAG: alpha/beta fold hydrolase [Burkholderiales bacterium]